MRIRRSHTGGGAKLVNGRWCIPCITWSVDEKGEPVPHSQQRTYMDGDLAAALLNSYPGPQVLQSEKESQPNASN